MGKVPVRLKEVVYMVSPFEVSIMNGLFKDFGKKCAKNISEVLIRDIRSHTAHRV